MSSQPAHCAVCPADDGLVGILVGEQQLFLCAHHRRRLGVHRAPSFDDLAAFFAALGIDRRSGDDRRQSVRRHFPPRPEGRRHGMGRRAADPRDL